MALTHVVDTRYVRNWHTARIHAADHHRNGPVTDIYTKRGSAPGCKSSESARRTESHNPPDILGSSRYR